MRKEIHLPRISRIYILMAVFVGLVGVVGYVLGNKAGLTCKVKSNASLSTYIPAHVQASPIGNSSYLHYDPTPKKNEALTIGRTPLSYTYLFRNPNSAYSRVIRRMTDMVEEYPGYLVINFRPAEMVGQDTQAMVDAVCISNQDQHYFWAYHQAVMKAGGPLDESSLRSFISGIGADEVSFYNCRQDKALADSLALDWSPNDMTSSDMIQELHVGSNMADRDELPCAAPNRADDSAGETVGCLAETLDRLSGATDGDNQAVKVNFLANGERRPLAEFGDVRGEDVLVLQRKGEFLGKQEYFIDIYATPLDLVRVGPLGGAHYTGQAQIIGDNLYLVMTGPAGVQEVSLLDGTSKKIYVDGGAWAGADESLDFFKIEPDRIFYMTCLMDEAGVNPEDWHLKMLSLETGEVEEVVTWDGFGLYTGPYSTTWNSETGILLLNVVGGDGGMSWLTQYKIDVPSREIIETVHAMTGYECVPGSEISDFCTKENMDSAALFDKIMGEAREGNNQHVIGCEKSGCRCGSLIVDEPSDMIYDRYGFLGCFQSSWFDGR